MGGVRVGCRTAMLMKHTFPCGIVATSNDMAGDQFLAAMTSFLTVSLRLRSDAQASPATSGRNEKDQTYAT